MTEKSADGKPVIALAVVQVDAPVSQPVLDALLAVDAITEARFVRLGDA